MMRFVLVAAVFIGAMAFDLRPAPANEGPWCAVVSIGKGGLAQDCSFRTLEECRPNVIAGNRGFCNRNPRWEGSYRPAEPRRHAHRH